MKPQYSQDETENLFTSLYSDLFTENEVQQSCFLSLAVCPAGWQEFEHARISYLTHAHYHSSRIAGFLYVFRVFGRSVPL